MTAPPHALNLVDAAASGPASFPVPLAAVAHPSFEKTADPVALAGRIDKELGEKPEIPADPTPGEAVNRAALLRYP